MNWIKFPLIMLLIFLIASAMAEDDPLNQDDAASMEDIRNTMGDDIFESNPDFLGNPTPVITEKNLSSTARSK